MFSCVLPIMLRKKKDLIYLSGNLNYQRESVWLSWRYMGWTKTGAGGREGGTVPLPSTLSLSSLSLWLLCISAPSPSSLRMSSSILYSILHLFPQIACGAWARVSAKLPGILLMVTVSVFLVSKPQETVYLFEPEFMGHLFLVSCFGTFLVQL